MSDQLSHGLSRQVLNMLGMEQGITPDQLLFAFAWKLYLVNHLGQWAMHLDWNDLILQVWKHLSELWELSQ